MFPPLSSIFPHLSKVGCYVSGFDRLRIVFAAVSVSQRGTVTVMLALSSLNRVAYASTGDRQWTPTSWTIRNLSTAFPFCGSLYVVNGGWGVHPSRILRIDPPDDSNPSSWSVRQPQMVATCPAEQLSSPALVECNSELLLVGYNNGYSRLVVLRVADLKSGAPTKHRRPNSLHWCMEHVRQLQEPTIRPRELHCHSQCHRWWPCGQGSYTTI